MPSINIAMERSLRRSAVDLLIASLRPALERRDVITDAQDKITDVKTAFSSWDNCMKASFCKWPVIAVIVIGGLIILSVVYCISRCLCCGLSCCCECCQCLKCCGDCCGCCDPPRGKRHKYLDEPYIPPNQGYRAEAPMTAGAIAPTRAPVATAAAVEPPQYAEFDVSKKGGEDALPEMPSWEGAGSKKVLLEEEAVEMDQLKKPENSAQAVPLMTGATPGAVSPVTPDSRSPYGHQGGQAAASGYFGAGAPATADPYGMQNQTAGVYGQSQNSFGTDQSYGVVPAGAIPAMGQDRRSPQQYGNGGYGPPPMDQGYQGQQSQEYGNNAYGRNVAGAPGMNQGYGPGPGRRSPGGPNMMGAAGYPGRGAQSPGPQGGAYPARTTQSPGPQGAAGYPSRVRQSPAPQGDYGFPAPYTDRRSPAPQQGDFAGAGRNYNNNNGRPYPPPQGSRAAYPRGQPERQYSADSSSSSRPLAAPRRQQSYDQAPASPSSLQNSGGFDFNSGFSRPQAYEDDGYERRPSEGRQGGGQGGAQGGGGAYPGYKAYQPATDNSRAQGGW
ncbi:Fibroin-3 related protein [Pleurostoma richardsiae]|uniref:Fibroin-3 related protein n=1 Tax=Pleurostoma richardsiae TaxID=41990 RepID=A0AA38RA50_9PEZI|nr:Fibroin-3 related protein [Pleurostoma richardsiae]